MNLIQYKWPWPSPQSRVVSRPRLRGIHAYFSTWARLQTTYAPITTQENNIWRIIGRTMRQYLPLNTVYFAKIPPNLVSVSFVIAILRANPEMICLLNSYWSRGLSRDGFSQSESVFCFETFTLFPAPCERGRPIGIEVTASWHVHAVWYRNYTNLSVKNSL